MTYKVQKTESSQIDYVGIQTRIKGQEIRDCIIILEPINSSYLCLLTRSEIQNTVLTSALIGEGGTLSIAKSRVKIPENDQNSRPNGLHISNRTSAFSISLGNYQKEEHSNNTLNLEEGRFPSNLILRHSSECYCEGTITISNTDSRDGSITDTPARSWKNASKDGIARKGYGGPEGEKIPNWICIEGCPIKAMDAQSGDRISNSAKYGVQEGKTSFWGNSGDTIHKNKGHGDQHGGASRFFKQVQSEEELNNYLNILIKR